MIQSPDVAERVILRLAGGNGPFDVDEVARQADEYGAGGAVADSVLKLLRWMGQAPPFPVLRLAEPRKWIESGSYAALLQGEYATRGQTPPRSVYHDVKAAAGTYLAAVRSVGARAPLQESAAAEARLSAAAHGSSRAILRISALVSARA